MRESRKAEKGLAEKEKKKPGRRGIWGRKPGNECVSSNQPWDMLLGSQQMRLLYFYFATICK